MAFTFSDLEKWIQEWESPGLEFKLSVQKEAGNTISAFANSHGGVIVFGVDSKTRQPVGVADPDKGSKRLRDVLDQCKPNLKQEQQFLRHAGRAFIILSVEEIPHGQNPCFYGDACFVRQGTTNEKLRGDGLVKFLQSRGVFDFENMERDATLDDLDLEKVNELLRRRGRDAAKLSQEDYKRILTRLDIATYGKSFSIKNSALLFFAKNPKRFFSNLKIRIVKYEGAEKFLDALKLDKTVEGQLPELITLALDTIWDGIGRKFVLEGPIRKEVHPYPEKSIRELITNAVGHRDYFNNQDTLIEIYDDRLQITNSGALLSGQSMDSLERNPEHRNPTVYNLLREFGFGEALGLGLQLVRRQFGEAKLPDPVFEELGGFFRATVYNGRTIKVRPVGGIESPRQMQALKFLERNKTIKAADYIKLVGVSTATAVKDLNELVKQGKLRKIGQYRGAYYELKTDPKSN